MRHRHLTAALAATAALATTALVAPAAHASIDSELKASGVVERIAIRHYPRYDFVANCDQYTGTRFWCTVSGTAGASCYRQGHASVHRVRDATGYMYWVTLRGLGQQCF